MKKIWLWVLFLFTLSIRLYFVFKPSTFSLDGYFTLRQIFHIQSTFLPLYQDALAFGGTTYLFTPLFYYILSFFSIFFDPILVMKIVPNIFMSCLVFSSFFLAKKLTDSDFAALMSAFISAFIPILFSTTIFSASALTLLLPLMILQLYAFLDGRKITFMILCFLLPAIHYFALVIPVGLFIFLLILKLEDVKLKKQYFELSLLSLTITSWMFLIFFKYALLQEGLSFFTSFPISLLMNQITHLNFINAIYLVGTIPFLYGIYAAYSYFHKPSKTGLLILSFCLTSLILLFTPLMNFNQSMMFLGLFLSILFSAHYTTLRSYFEKTKLVAVRYYWNYFVVSVCFSLVISALIPSIFLASQESSLTVSNQELEALSWLSKEVNSRDIIFASAEESQLINSFGIKTMVDEDWVLAPNMPERYDAYLRILSTPYRSEATKELNKYDVSYIYLSRAEITFPDKFDASCFKEVFNNEVKILEVRCQLRNI